jgi:hypothetical protein
MENHSEHTHIHTPDGCFSLEALEVFQSFEGKILNTVNYYLWVNDTEKEASPYRFLYFLELIFEEHETLLLTSGEDSTALQISTASELVDTANALRELNNRISIQRILANPHVLWTEIIGSTLESINLSPNEEKYYMNDSLMLDFGKKQIIVQLSKREGLELIDWNA